MYLKPIDNTVNIRVLCVGLWMFVLTYFDLCDISIQEICLDLSTGLMYTFHK